MILQNTGFQVKAAVGMPPHGMEFDIFTELSISEFAHFYADYGDMLNFAGVMAFDRIQSLSQLKQADIDAALTSRERECLLWLSQGLRNDEVAERLDIKLVTVDFHLTNARRKLNAKTSAQALAIAVRAGLVVP